MDFLPQVLEWFGDHWWIIFPIMGVAGGLGSAWEKSAKRRHQRRLETLRIKGEIKAAQLAARAQGKAIKPTRHQPDEVDANAPVPSSQLLQRLFAEHDEITARWLEYELDVAKLIAFPAMSDGRQPLTAAFLRAKKVADALRPDSADAKVSEQQITEYLDAVGNYAVAFEIAEKDARRLRDSTFTEAERKRLDRAQQLLKVAVDESATQAERNIAYKRVRDELDGLILLSDQAVEVLEKQVAREITQAPPQTTPPQSAPPAAGPPRADPLPKDSH